MSDKLTMLRDLKARIDAAKGVDLELDAELMLFFDYVKLNVRKDGSWALFKPAAEEMKNYAFASGVQGGRQDAIRCLSGLLDLIPLTASIDAAVALIERVLPGCSHGYHTHVIAAPFVTAHIGQSKAELTNKGWPSVITRTRPALALLSALFAALIAKEEANS